MRLSPDFFPYFEATAPLLDADPSLFCVSSWNDHGQVPPLLPVACCGSIDIGAGAAASLPDCLHLADCCPPPALPQDRFVSNATQLYRSDFFPGLGWMLNRRVWESIRDRW